ncbi:MAG: hypothetical protein K6E40_04700, partial [Desulfovibrio sp.]|nr:hypothetical protein [Desulfovibrio sp.]
EQVPLTEEQKPAPAPAPKPRQEDKPPVEDSRIRAEIDEAFLDYVEGNGMDMARAEAICRNMVEGKACANLTEAHKMFVEKQYTCFNP